MDPITSDPRPSDNAEEDLRTVMMPGDEATLMMGTPPGAAGGPASVVFPPESYQVGSEIARGGMGAILEVEDQKLGRKVAMKVMRLEVDASEDQRQRFIREAMVLARLEHPNIVPIHELGRDAQERLYYTMKLVHGQTLQAILNSVRSGDGAMTRHYTLDRLLTIFRKVCDALSLAHAKGVIHRDLKPDNVMVGEFGEVLVMDWGIAKILNEEGHMPNGAAEPRSSSDIRHSDISGTMDGSVMGTPQYMSPEQAEGRLRDIDQQSDVFSLGGILYAILTLRAPVEGTTVPEVLENIRTGRIRQPTQFNTLHSLTRGERIARGDMAEPVQFFPLRHCPGERVPAALSAVAMKALAVKKEKRYTTIAEFAADIEAYQGGFATTAEHAGLGTQIRLLVKRNKVLSASAALILALSVLFTARVVRERNHVKRALTETDQQRRIAQNSLVEAERQRQLAQESLVEQQRQTAKLTMREAMNLCEHGEVGRGLQWMVRALRIVTEIGDTGQERIIRYNLGTWSAADPELLCAWRPPQPGVMRAVAFSPDGKRALTSHFHRTAQLWDLATGKPVGPALQHKDDVFCVGFSGDGKIMATGSRDKTVRLWDPATGKTIGEPIMHTCEVFLLALNRDGSRLLTASNSDAKLDVGPRDRKVEIWDTKTGKTVCPPLKWAGRTWRGYWWPIALSPDGKMALTGTADWDAQLWDATTGEKLGKPLSTLNRSSMRWFLAAAFSPDSTKLATGASDNSLRLWDVKTQQPIGEPMIHPDYVLAVAFSPDGSEIVTGSKDQAVRIWNTATGRQSSPTLVHRDQVDVVAMGPKGATVWTASRDGAAARDPGIRGWAAGGNKPVSPPLKHDKEVWHAHFSPDGKTMITTTETDVAYWWDIAAGRKTGEKKVSGGGHIHASALSRDGKMLAVGTCGEWSGRLGDAHPASLTVGDTALPRFIYKNVVWDVAVSRDGTRVIIGGKSKDAQVFDALTAKPVGASMKHTDEVNRVALSPDGKIALTGGDDRIARLWDAETGAPLCDPLPHDEAVRAAAFSPDGRTFITASGPNLWFWDTATRQRTGTPLQLDEYIQRAEFSPDGKLIVTVGDNATITWDAASGVRLGPPLPHAGAACAEFSPDGARIVTCGRDKFARVWLAPRRADGPVERIALWVDTLTGSESDEHGAIRALDSAAWRRRHEQLAASGGAPLPPLMTIPVPLPDKSPIDLLALADVKLDAQQGIPAKPGQPGGTWQRTKDAVRSPGNEGCRLDMPFVMTGDYRMRVGFTMRDGLNAMDVTFPVGDRVASLIFGAGKRNGLEMINHLKAEADGNPARVGAFKLERDKPHDLLIAVKISGSEATIEVTLDGREFTKWTGPQTALDPEIRGYHKGLLGLKPWVTVIDFHEWKLDLTDAK